MSLFPAGLMNILQQFQEKLLAERAGRNRSHPVWIVSQPAARLAGNARQGEANLREAFETDLAETDQNEFI